MEGGPFGAAIAKDGRVIAASRNKVLVSDASAHAEINAIRTASEILGTYDLSSCVIFSTTEPCPMCFSAIHWARISKLYFGTDITDAAKLGFNELPVSVRELSKSGKSPVKIFPAFMRDECMELFLDWENLEEKIIY
jgi:guanine deaminase